MCPANTPGPPYTLAMKLTGVGLELVYLDIYGAAHRRGGDTERHFNNYGAPEA